MRKYFRITYYIGGILVFVIVAAIGYTQTRSFKTYLRDFLLRESQTSLNGELQFGTIEGNLITGFKINNVTITEGGVVLFAAQRLKLKYDPFGIPFKRIGISNAVIIKPRIYICRSLNGSTNIVRLIKPSSAQTTPSPWNVELKRLELVNAEVLFIDSLLLHQREIGECVLPPDSAVDYARVHLYPLTLVASAQVHNDQYSIKIRNLSTAIRRDDRFISEAQGAIGQRSVPVITLEHVGGDFLLTKKEVSARNMALETASTHIHCDAALKGIDITGLSSLEELKTIPIEVSLTAEDMNTKELKQFLYPSVDFLDRSVRLQLKARGTLGELNVENLSLQMAHSFINLRGQIRNIHRPRDLEMTVQAVDNMIEPQDLFACLPGLHLPDLTFFGPVKFSLSYEGRPLDFKAHFAGSTAAGDVTVNGKMNIDPENTSYAGTIEVHSLALGMILKNRKLSSDLNGRLTIDATGFNPRTMTGTAKVEIDSSSLSGLSIQHSVFIFDVADNMLRSHVAATIGNGTYELSSLLTFFQTDSTKYSVAGKIRSLDLSDLLKDPQDNSDLSFDLSAAGTIGASTRSDTAELHFYPSSFASQPFESAQAKATYQVRDSAHSVLQIASTMGDVGVDGNFTPGSFIAAWKNSYQLVTEGIAYRFHSLDSIRSFSKTASAPPLFHSSPISSMSPIDARYHVRRKISSPSVPFFMCLLPDAALSTAALLEIR